MDLLTGLVFACVFLFMLYKWITLNDNYFVRRNIPALKPEFLTGNMFKFTLGQRRPNEFFGGIYNQFPDEKYENKNV